MTSKFTTEFKEKFIRTKTDYDSMNQAIKLAKLNGVDEKGVQTLISIKQSLKEECEQGVSTILGAMPLSNNTIHIQDQWYGIRYLSDKTDLKLKVDIIRSKDLPILQRDGRRERELLRTDINSLLPGCLDEVRLEIYKKAVSNRAKEMVFDYTGIQVQQEASSEDILTVSSHAGKRYVQRVLGIGPNNDDIAETYRRSNLKEVEEAVIKGYESAELMWRGEDDITYSFDKDNLMYVVGGNNIITLYEEDFGFSKEINRIITLEQVEVLEESYSSLEEARKAHEEAVGGISKELSDISSEIDLLESKIDYLVSRRATLTTTKEQGAKGVKVAVSEFNKEFNKLFKKWDS